MSNIENMLPEAIERRSFEIITEELGAHSFSSEELLVVKRVIHTTADFDYRENLKFSNKVVDTFLEAIRRGVTIVTDTQMAQSGINKKALAQWGCEVKCFMADEDVAKEAKDRATTRAAISMEKASQLEGPCIFAIGNAPTALIKLHELIVEGQLSPVGIIAAPVGFVNVVESKELIQSLEHIPSIITLGRKGGSNVAAAIINAVVYQIGERG